MANFDCHTYLRSAPREKEGWLKSVTVELWTQEFAVYCDSGLYREADSGNLDITHTMAFDMDDCLRDCANYNRIQDNMTCIGAYFSGDFTAAQNNGNAGMNCALKYPTPSALPATNGNNPGPKVAAAVLQALAL